MLGPTLQASIRETLACVCPYRGLNFFREEDAPFFCGREAATAQLIEAVGRHPLIAVVGNSGSGKSSFVRAGLVPALRNRRDDAWEIVTLMPGDRPLYNLSAALLPLLEPEMGEVARLGEIQRLADQLASGITRLRDVVERVLARQPGTLRLLLVADQWEELFTLTEDSLERQRFIDSLLEATAKSSLSVVLTLRGDYFGRAVTSHRELSDRLQGAQVNLAPMTKDELRRAIIEPAVQVGLEFEANLVDLILEQAVGEPGHLPLLEFVLRELWEKRQGRLMHRAAYDAIGQLEGAIAAHAETVYEDLTQSDGQAAERIRALMLRLIRLGEGEQDTRRRISLGDLDAPTTRIAGQFVNQRLLVSSAAAGSQLPTVEVAHEALLARWSRLRNWIDTDREFIAWRQRLGDATREWEKHKRTTALLWRGLLLAQASDWLRQRRGDLSEQERAFIGAGIKRRKSIFAISSFLATSVIVSISYLQFNAVREANRAAELAKQSRQSIAQTLFAVSATQAAVDRATDTRIRELQSQIEILQAQLGAVNTTVPKNAGR